MKHLKLIFACLLTAIFSIGQVWAGDVTWSWNTVANLGSANSTTTSPAGDKTLAGTVSGVTTNKTWTLAMTSKTSKYYLSSGQFGSNNNACSAVSLSTTAFTDPVKYVRVNASAGGTATITITVGSTTYVDAESLTSSEATYANSTAQSATGTITISYSQPSTSKNMKIYSIEVVTDAGGDPDPVLQSIAVSGNPTTDTYEDGNVFDVTGLVVTGSYDVGDDATISEGITWKVRTNALSDDEVALANYHLTEGQTSLQVQATVSEIVSDWYTVSGLTVNEHVVDPGTYDIVPNNAFFNTSASGTISGDAANLTYSGTQNDVTITYAKGSQSNMYINASQTRTYSGSVMTFSVPTGYNLKSIAFTADGSNWAGTHTANAGAMTNNKLWEGTANSVQITFGGTCRITGIEVTYAADVKYGVSFSAPTGGTLVIKDGDDPIFSGDTFDEDKELTVIIAPDETHTGGAIVVTKTDGGDDVTASVLSGTTLTVPAYAITVSASFTPTYAINIVADGGSVALEDGNGDPITGRVVEGTEVMATATADASHVFESLSLSDNVTDPDIDENVAMFTMPAGNVTITATFTNKPCTKLGTPTNVAASGTSYPYNAATLDWDDVSNADAYEVVIKKAGVEVESDIVDESEYSFSTTLLANTTYTYEIKATSDNTSDYCESDVASANFATNDYPSVTLYYSENGNVSAGVSQKILTDFALPSSIMHTCTKDFVGWTVEAYKDYSDEDDAPEEFYAPGATYQIPTNANCTIYAVYATVTGGGTTTTNIKYTGSTTSNMTGNNDAATFGLDAADWSVVGYKGGGSNFPGLNKDGTIRLYYNASGNSYITISAPSTISSVALTCKSGNDNAIVKVGDNAITLSDGVYPINATSFTIINGETTSNQVHIQNIAVNITSVGVASDYVTSCTDALDNPTFSLATEVTPVAGKYEESISVVISATEGTIHYTTDGTNPDGESPVYSEPIALTECGTTTIKAIAIGTGSQSAIVSETYIINLPIDNTAGTAYTPAEAIAIIDGECDKSVPVFVQGVVTSATFETSDKAPETYQNKAYNVYVKEIGTDGSVTFEFYRMLNGELKEAFTNGDIVIGDTLIAKGTLTKFGSTYEFAAGCYLVERKPYTASKVDISNTKETAYTVAHAIELIDDFTSDLSKTVFVKGVVSSISGSNIFIHDVNVENSFEFYGCVSVAGVGVNDTIIGTGTLKKHNSTYEFNSGCEVVENKKYVAPVTGVSLDATAEVKAGKTITLTPVFTPEDATNTNVSWASDDESIATVANGVVTGMSEGTAHITVTTEALDGNGDPFTATCTVTVLPGNNFAAADWKLVTDADELAEGSFVIIAAADADVAMMAYVSGNNCGQEAAIKDGNYLDYNANFGIFKILAGKQANTIALYDEAKEKYLYAASSSNNYLKAEAELTDNSSWSVSVTEAGVATLTAQGTNTRNQLKYNSGSSIFSCYGSGQQDIALYKYYTPAFRVYYNDNVENEDIAMPRFQRADGENKVVITSERPARDGYKFLGWKDAENNEYAAGVTKTLTGNVTLFAQWEAATAHTVTYTANGGTGTAPAAVANAVEGDVITVLGNTYTNPGFFFIGWTVSYNDGSSIRTIEPDEEGQFSMPNYDVTIAANWSRKSNQKWQLVKDASTLTADKKYIIAAAGDYNYVMGEQAEKNRSAVEVQKIDEMIVGPEAMQVFTLKGSSGSWEFYTGSGYIYAAASGANQLKTQTTNDVNGKWAISISTEDEVTSASVVASGSSNRNVMQFNYATNYQLFACYATASQKAVALYEEIPVTEVTEDDDTETDVPDNADVTVKENGVLTIGAAKTLGDVRVENGGKIDADASLTTVNMTITTKAGQSGQIEGADKLNITGDLFLEINLCSGDLDADYWYCIAVPFDVNIADGVLLADGTPLEVGVDFEVWEYDTQKHAENARSGWKRASASSKMQAGHAYLIGFNDGMVNTIMLKAANKNFFNGTEISLVSAECAEDPAHSNWNAVANPTTHYVAINKAVEVFNNNTHVFDAVGVGEADFVVGRAFFLSSTGTIDLSEATHGALRAPQRASNEYSYSVRIAREDAENYDNQMVVRASEDAKNTYEAEHDMITLNDKTAPVAMLWTENYGGKRLAIEEAPLIESKATYALGFYAPADGTYTINVAEPKDNAVLYLTYEGRIIWNLSAEAYTLNLKKGNTNGYGLLLQAKAPHTATGIDSIETGAEAQKVILNENVYILRGTQMYDVTGKMVK